MSRTGVSADEYLRGARGLLRFVMRDLRAEYPDDEDVQHQVGRLESIEWMLNDVIDGKSGGV